MMRRVSGRYKVSRCADWGEGVKGCVRAGGGQVKPSLAPVRTDLLNASGSRRIMQENLAKATERDRRWYATTVKNVLDRANVAGVKEAA